MSPKNSPHSEETKKQNNRRLQDSLFYAGIQELANWLRDQRLLAENAVQELVELFNRSNPEKSEDLALVDVGYSDLAPVEKPVETPSKKVLPRIQSILAEAYKTFLEKAPKIFIQAVTEELNLTEEGKAFLAREGSRLEAIVKDEVLPILQQGVEKVFVAPSKEDQEREQADCVEKAFARFDPLKPEPVVRVVLRNNTGNLFCAVQEVLARIRSGEMNAQQLVEARLAQSSQKSAVTTSFGNPASLDDVLRAAFQTKANPFVMVPRPVRAAKEVDIYEALRPSLNVK